ncbi:MAG TPA: M50 family metallopeptidase [Acidimicrobiales bacterium]|nr:M50 family metallopeptidase [Acidimicrobiales bacterium]
MTQTSPTPTIEDARVPGPDVQSAERRKLLMLAGILTGGIVLSLMTGTFAVVGFCLAIVAVVMLHEAAHFAVAKLSGMKATEFFFGFGPRLWSVRKGETEYGIKALPFGGYVKIIGMSNLERDIDPADEPRTYRQASYPKRMAVALAGVATHFVLAFVLLVVLLSAVGVPNYDKPTLEVGSLSRLDTGASPAVDAGFQVGDRIVAVNGTPVSSWDDVPPFIRTSAGQPVTFLVERDGVQQELRVVPTVLERNGETRGFVGISPRPAVETMSPLAASREAVGDIWTLTTGSFAALGSFFAPGSLADYAGQLTNAGGDSATAEGEGRFVSVVGVARIAGQAAESGLFNVVYLLVLLNIFVGVFNLIPLLPLDGGHVAIATYERIRSRAGRRYQADVGKMMPVAAAVIVVLVLIGVTSIYLDIVQPLSNPFQ